MERNSRVLISIICTLMICLLASTATTTVAAGEWGNLTVGDTMEWDTDVTAVTDEGPWNLSFTTKMEILEINDGTLSIKLDKGGQPCPSPSIEETGQFRFVVAMPGGLQAM